MRNSMKLYASFVSGLDKPVREILQSAVKGVSIRQTLDGGVIFEGRRILEAAALPCFQNVFEIIRTEKYRGRAPIEFMMNRLLREPWQCGAQDSRAKRADATFRLVTSMENRLVSVDARRKDALEALIAKKTGLRVERAGADTEFWLLYRSEGLVLFMRRLTTHKADRKRAERGALSPALAHVMNHLSRPTKDDVYLDPFAGSGALCLSRAGIGACRALYAMDRDKVKAQRLKKAAKTIGEHFKVICGDMTGMERWIPAGTVTKIVTDPPWGMFAALADPFGFYDKMLSEMIRAAKDGCRAVVLTAARAEMEKAMGRCKKNIRSVEVYSILVSGKKAGVYCFEIHPGL